jgi:SAM-dependent methyltransferase
MANDFDPKSYWETRLGANYDLHGVGLIEWGPWFNQWLYRVRRHGFLKAMRAQRSEWSDAGVLDIGSGTGFYLERWRELGVRNISGADLTEVAVAQLQQKFPDMSIMRCDIGDAPLAGKHEAFDAVSCMDVLFHIVDDANYAKAFRNIAQMLKSDGYFIFSDSWMKGDDVRGVHIVHRSRERVKELLDDAGFEVIETRPMFILMNAPVDSQNPLLRAWWWSLYQVTARFHRIGGLLAALIYPLERLLLALAGDEGPTTKVIICRKRAGH